MGNTPIAPLGGPSPAEDEFKIYTTPGDVRFLSKAVQPPSVVYVESSDDLVVSCATTQTNESVLVTYRLLRADGELILGQIQALPLNTRAVLTESQSLAEGFLLSVSCKAARAATRGQTFVRVFLTDPSAGPNVPTYMLMADYVTTAMAPAYPNGRVLAPIEGPGALATPTISSPGAGAEFSINVPSNTRWRLWALGYQLVTSAAGTARISSVTYSTGIGITLRNWAGASQAVSTTGLYDASDVAPFSLGTVNLFHVSVPDNLFLESGCQIRSLTANIDPGDQYTLTALLVEEWLLNV